MLLTLRRFISPGSTLPFDASSGSMVSSHRPAEEVYLGALDVTGREGNTRIVEVFHHRIPHFPMLGLQLILETLHG
jgi:hypothetical protein